MTIRDPDLGQRYDGVPAIAKRRYGEDTPRSRRQTRHLIAAHGFPIVQRGRLIWTHEAWLQAYDRGETVEIGRAG